MKGKVTLSPEELWCLNDQGYTQQQLGEHMGVTRQLISKLIDQADFMTDIDRWECGHEPACLPAMRDLGGLRRDIHALRLRGMGSIEIAAELGMSRGRLWKVESGEGMKGGTPSAKKTQGGRAA